MNNDVRIWDYVVSVLEDALPTFEVSRKYDILEALTALENQTGGQVFVCLDGKDTEAVTPFKVQDTYHFAIFIVKYISAQDTATVTEQMDAMFPMVQQVQDRFYLRAETIPADGNTAPAIDVKLISGDPDSGELYDLDFFGDSESFLCAMSAGVVTFREVNRG